jgi:hypothetical protein
MRGKSCAGVGSDKLPAMKLGFVDGGAVAGGAMWWSLRLSLDGFESSAAAGRICWNEPERCGNRAGMRRYHLQELRDGEEERGGRAPNVLDRAPRAFVSRA